MGVALNDITLVDVDPLRKFSNQWKTQKELTLTWKNNGDSDQRVEIRFIQITEDPGSPLIIDREFDVISSGDEVTQTYIVPEPYEFRKDYDKVGVSVVFPDEPIFKEIKHRFSLSPQPDSVPNTFESAFPDSAETDSTQTDSSSDSEPSSSSGSGSSSISTGTSGFGVGTQKLNVNVRISIEGKLMKAQTDTAIKSVKAKQTHNGRSANGTIKLVAESTEPFKPIKKEGNSGTATIQINGMQIYKGTISKVVEQEDGIVKVELISRLSKLTQNHSLTASDIKNKPSTTELLKRLLIEKGPFRSENVKIDITSPNSVAKNVGIESTRNLRNAVEMICSYQGALFYADARDRLVITTNPLSSGLTKVWKPTVFKSASKGDEENTKKRVIVRSTKEGPIAGILSSETTAASVGKKSATANQTEVVTDHTVPDKKTAAQVALTELIRNQTNSNAGTVTLIGDPRVRAYDGIVVELPSGQTPLVGLNGRYTIKNVTHTFSATDGYTTEVDLMKDLKTVYENLTDQSGFAETIAGKMYTGEATPLDPEGVNNGLSRYRNSTG